MRSKSVALGGVLAALAVVIMSLGTMIPVATYAAPMLCILLGNLVFKSCGRSVAWAWYGAVAILGLLLAPDKEAALVFAFLGYYPIVRPWRNRKKPAFLWKGLYFNVSVLVLYWIVLFVIGLEAEDMGEALAMVLLALGNLVFFLLDKILERKW